MTDRRLEEFLELIADEDCRTILTAIESEPKTVPEISEECEIPLSTAYRKINKLEEAAVIEEKTRLQRGCKPKNVYEERFESAVITIGDDGELAVEFEQPRPEQSAAQFGAPSPKLIEGD